LGLGLSKTFNSVGGSGRKAVKHRRPSRSVWGVEKENRPEGLWRTLGQKLSVLKEKWRAEVGPRMRGVRPATDGVSVER